MWSTTLFMLATVFGLRPLTLSFVNFFLLFKSFLTGLLRSELHPHKPDLAAVCIKSPPDEEVARSGTPEDFVRATVVRVRTERSLNRYLFFPICASQNGSEVRFCGGGGVG